MADNAGNNQPELKQEPGREISVRMQYDREADAAYIKLSGSPTVARTEAVNSNVNIDLTADGRLAGIEILNASKVLDERLLETRLERHAREVAESPRPKRDIREWVANRPKSNISPEALRAAAPEAFPERDDEAPSR